MLRTAGGRLFHMLGPQAEKARLPNSVRVRFTTAGLRQPELTSMRVCGVECNQVGEIRRTSIVWNVMHQRRDLEDDAVLDGQPVQLLQCWSDVRPPVTIEH